MKLAERPAKIYHVTHSNITDDARIIRSMDAHEEAGYNVFGLGISGGEENSLFEKRKNLNLTIKSTKILPRKIRLIFVYFELSIKVLIALKNIRPDIVHCHDTVILPIISFAKFFFRYKIIYDAHELESDQGDSFLHSRLTYFAEKVCWPSLDGFITVSESIQNWYLSKFSNVASTVILNSPTISKIYGSEKNYLRNYFKISKSSTILIYVGLVVSGRGLENICRALTSFSHNYSLVILGEGDLKVQLKEQFGSNEWLYFHDFIEHNKVVNIVSSADIGLCLLDNPSLSDFYCLPNKLFEYLFAGIPILACNYPEIEKLVTDLNCGQVVDDNNLVEELKKKYDFTVPNIENFKEVFGWEAQKLKLLTFYNDLKKE